MYCTYGTCGLSAVHIMCLHSLSFQCVHDFVPCICSHETAYGSLSTKFLMTAKQIYYLSNETVNPYTSCRPDGSYVHGSIISNIIYARSTLLRPTVYPHICGFPYFLWWCMHILKVTIVEWLMCWRHVMNTDSRWKRKHSGEGSRQTQQFNFFFNTSVHVNIVFSNLISNHFRKEIWKYHLNLYYFWLRGGGCNGFVDITHLPLIVILPSRPSSHKYNSCSCPTLKPQKSDSFKNYIRNQWLIHHVAKS